MIFQEAKPDNQVVGLRIFGGMDRSHLATLQSDGKGMFQATLGTSSNQALFHKGLQMLRGEVCVPRCFFESNHPGSWVWGDHASTPKQVFGEGHDTWLYRWCICLLGTWKRWWKLPLTMIDKDQKCHLVCVYLLYIMFNHVLIPRMIPVMMAIFGVWSYDTLSNICQQDPSISRGGTWGDQGLHL